MQCIVKAVKTGKGCGGIDVLANLPDGGVVTKANASKFGGVARLESFLCE